MDAKAFSPPKWVAQAQNFWPKELQAAIERWFNELWIAVPRVRSFTVTLDPPLILAGQSVTLTAAVAGLTAQDIPVVALPATTAAVSVGIGGAWCTQDTLHVMFINSRGALNADAPSAEYSVVVTRR